MSEISAHREGILAFSEKNTGKAAYIEEAYTLPLGSIDSDKATFPLPNGLNRLMI